MAASPCSTKPRGTRRSDSPRISATRASSKPSFFRPAVRNATAASTPIRRAASGWAKRRSSLVPERDQPTSRSNCRSNCAIRWRASKSPASDRPVPSASSMRRRNGIASDFISGESREEAQPLLAPLYYIEKALKPYADLAVAQNANLSQGLDSVLKQNISVLMLADIGTLTGEAAKKVDDFVKRGGLLVRFAGPRLEKAGDDLLPVPLRSGGRSLGGALSWSSPQPLAAFDENQSVRRPHDSERRHGQPAGARRSGGADAGSRDLGAAQGRHAARHGDEARQRPPRAVSRHRQLGLVEFPDLGIVRRNAATPFDDGHHRGIGTGRQRDESRHDGRPPTPTCSHR